MRILRLQGKLLLFAMLAMFAVPAVARADHGRGHDRGRVVVYAEFGRRDHSRYHRDDYGYREGWRHERCEKRRYYQERYYDRYPRRVHGSVVVRIPF